MRLESNLYNTFILKIALNLNNNNTKMSAIIVFSNIPTVTPINIARYHFTLVSSNYLILLTPSY